MPRCLRWPLNNLINLILVMRAADSDLCRKRAKKSGQWGINSVFQVALLQVPISVAKLRNLSDVGPSSRRYLAFLIPPLPCMHRLHSRR